MFSRRSCLLLLLTVLLSSIALWAAKDFVPPRAENANTYACKDAHPNEHVTAAIDLYNTAPKDNIFVTSYNQQGILPVFLVITNDSNQPITLKDMHAQLVTARSTKLESLGTDDVFRRVAHINGSSNPQRVGPITLGGTKNKKAQKQYQEIVDAIFAAEAVEPHTTKSGFLFFDVEDVKQSVDGANIYLTGIRDAAGNELMYFDIPTTPSTAAASGAQ